MSGIQTWNFDVKKIARQIQSEHNGLHNKKQGVCAQSTDESQSKFIDGTGNALQMRLSIDHRRRFFGLGPKVQYTKVELFNKEGKAIGKFKFNRGKNLEKNIKSVLDGSQQLGKDVIDLRKRWLAGNTLSLSQTTHINGQQFNITISSKHMFLKKVSANITIADLQGHSVTFPFCSGNRLKTKLNAALQSIASQVRSECNQKCNNMAQKLSEWSNHDGNSGILQQMQTTQMNDASQGDWASQFSEQRKIIGRLQHPTSVLRNTLELLGSGKTIGDEGQRILERPDQMINQTLSALQAAKNKGIINEEQSNALLNDLKSAVNTIAKACPDNEALQKFASDFAKLTLTKEK